MHKPSSLQKNAQLQYRIQTPNVTTKFHRSQKIANKVTATRVRIIQQELLQNGNFFVDTKSGPTNWILTTNWDWHMVIGSYESASTNNIVVNTRDPFL